MSDDANHAPERQTPARRRRRRETPQVRTFVGEIVLFSLGFYVILIFHFTQFYM